MGPALLVLGEEARENGLKVSLLERLKAHYRAIGDKTNYLQANLTENYRCHKYILKFASEMFYKSNVMRSSVTDNIHSVHGFPFPMVFVCTGSECIGNYEGTVNEKEAIILMSMLSQNQKHILKQKICVMSSSRGQVYLCKCAM